MYDAASTDSHVACEPASWAGPPEAAPVPARRVGPARSRCKRGLDLLLGAVGLVFVLPLLIPLALLVRLESPGPAIFRQRRSGLDGRVFTIWKLRTMTVADPRRPQCDGDRVTRLGRFLRRSSLDELPQLINVLRGEMSLVGPRPHAVQHDLEFGRLLPAYAGRFRTRPGLTGLAQVSGRRGPIRDFEALAARVHDDNGYIESWSLRGDIAILWRTLPRLVRDARGA